MTSTLSREWLGRLGVQALFIEPGSPWENGYVESFNGRFQDEFLDREILYRLQEAKVLIERWRKEYNTIRPYSSLGYRPAAPEAIRPFPPRLPLRFSRRKPPLLQHEKWYDRWGRVSPGSHRASLLRPSRNGAHSAGHIRGLF